MPRGDTTTTTRGRGPLSVALVLIASLGLPSAAVAGDETHRIAVVVGNNHGARGEAPLRYAEAEAREMLAVLGHLGGVRSEWSYLLVGKGASVLRKVFAEVRERIREIGPRGRVLLLLYYSGHADGRSLHLGDSSVSLAEVRRFVTGSGARLGIAIVDACHSGALARAKGVRRGPGYDISAVAGRASTSGHVIITSSGPEELSQETDAVRGSYFSHFVISGLRGAADASLDGLVTLSELYQYAYGRTLARTSGSRVGVQHAVREVRLHGSGEVVLTRLYQGHAAIRFPAGLRGTYYVVRKRGGDVVAEVELGGQEATVALPADTYVVRTRADGRLWVAQLNLSWGGTRRFDRQQLRAYDLEGATARGGLDPSPHRLRLGASLRTGAVSGETLVYGLTAGYRLHRGPWAVGVSGGWHTGAFDTRDTRVRSHAWHGLLEGGWLPLRDRLELCLGLRAGLAHVQQRVAGAAEQGSFGGQFETFAQLAYVLRDPFFAFVDLGIGASLYAAARAEVSARLLAGGTVGVGLQL